MRLAEGIGVIGVPFSPVFWSEGRLPRRTPVSELAFGMLLERVVSVLQMGLGEYVRREEAG